MIKPNENVNKVTRTTADEPSRFNKMRLDRNDRNIPFSDQFIQHIRNRIDSELFMVYPETLPLYSKIANWLNIHIDQLVLNSGSEQSIKSIFETYISKGDKILLHFPGFAMYEVYAKLYQAEIVSQYFEKDLSFNWESFINKIDKNIRMVVVENPNGFIGIAPSEKYLEEIITKANKFDVIVLVDEAYFHFYDKTVQKWTNKYDNLIISRSFSKAFGLAGLRAGYLISNNRNIEFLKRVRPVYEINNIGILLITELINNFDEIHSYINNIKTNLAEFRKCFSELGIPTSDSKTNFLAVRLSSQQVQDELRATLNSKDILIRRHFREENLKEWIRIGAGPLHIQSIVIDELKKIFIKYKLLDKK